MWQMLRMQNRPREGVGSSMRKGSWIAQRELFPDIDLLTGEDASKREFGSTDLHTFLKKIAETISDQDTVLSVWRVRNKDGQATSPLYYIWMDSTGLKIVEAKGKSDSISESNS